jgi:hypothetical protein
MVDLYVKLVLAGKRTIDQVPEVFREQVREKIEANE